MNTIETFQEVTGEQFKENADRLLNDVSTTNLRTYIRNLLQSTDTQKLAEIVGNYFKEKMNSLTLHSEKVELRWKFYEILNEQDYIVTAKLQVEYINKLKEFINKVTTVMKAELETPANKLTDHYTMRALLSNSSSKDKLNEIYDLIERVAARRQLTDSDIADIRSRNLPPKAIDMMITFWGEADIDVTPEQEAALRS